MENILAHIQIGNSKDEVGYLIRQTQKYRKRNGKTSRYYSHAYIYNDWGLGYKKLYVRKADVSLVRNKIAEVKKSLDREKSKTQNLIKDFYTFEVVQNQIWEDLEKNPNKYTYRAKVALVHKYTNIWM